MVLILLTIELGNELWSSIDNIVRDVQGPLLISGDCNSVLLEEDRFQGYQFTEHEILDLQGNSLTIVKTIGSKFTWCND